MDPTIENLVHVVIPESRLSESELLVIAGYLREHREDKMALAAAVSYLLRLESERNTGPV